MREFVLICFNYPFLRPDVDLIGDGLEFEVIAGIIIIIIIIIIIGAGGGLS
jgi:hypothetical protein